MAVFVLVYLCCSAGLRHREASVGLIRADLLYLFIIPRGNAAAEYLTCCTASCQHPHEPTSSVGELAGRPAFKSLRLSLFYIILNHSFDFKKSWPPFFSHSICCVYIFILSTLDSLAIHGLLQMPT